jgi:DNA-binding transcriptional regulator YhcF (GntR family)
MAGHKVEMVKRNIVRYIYENDLSPGDKLPGCNRLRDKLKVGNGTILSALRGLDRDGVIKIVDKVGAYVKKTHTDGHTGWRIGVVCAKLSTSQFNSLLAHYIIGELSACGCIGEIFYLRQDLSIKEKSISDYYPGLLRKINHRELDGVIWLTKVEDINDAILEKVGAKWVYVGANLPMTNSVICDFGSILETMLINVMKSGYVRPAVIVSNQEYIQNYVYSFFEKFCGQNFPSVVPAENYYADCDIAGGQRIARQILEINVSGKRPDALVFLDDCMAQGACSVLAYEKYCPQFFLLRNKQIPIELISRKPVTYFELDIHSLATSAVVALVKIICGETIDFPICFNVKQVESNLY